LIDIALALSFSSQANFTRAFRQATGLAPGQYRREIGSKGNSLQAAIRAIWRNTAEAAAALYGNG
jgi:AraC family transcriptional regulator